ncbi:MAG: type IV secretory system conjugative DNA transfer family protein [Chitinophagaceae bacterium]|nr:type IV secretory system conjugative DNA transfer family protein [Chitinophagaceae bacterium]
MIQLVNLILGVVAGIFEAILDVTINGIVSLVPSARKKEYNADFIEAGKVLRSRDTGFCITGRRSLSIDESYKNCLCLGGSGSGKSSTVLINSALKMADGNSSLIFNDPSGEIRMSVSGALKKAGYKILILKYDDDRSQCFNPLLRCKSISDIQKLSNLLLRVSLGESYHRDAFWNRNAESLTSVIIRYLIFHCPVPLRTFHNVLALLNEFAAHPEKVDKLFVRTKDQQLISEYSAFVSYGDKTLSGIIAVCKSALSIFSDETVAKVTSIDTIDFKQFRKEKTALFINNSVPDMHYYGVLSSLFFQQFFNEVLSKIPGKEELSIFFLLDEASSLYLSSLSTTIANIRKSFGGILLLFQDYHQIEHLYGSYEAKNISANCFAKVYLPGQPIETCKMLESVLGQFQYYDDEENLRTRHLLSADEIRILEKAIILLGNKPPILTKMYPFYEDRKLKRLTELPACEPDNVLPFDTPPVIQFQAK